MTAQKFNDSVVSALLKTETFGRSLRYFDKTASTQSIAQQLASAENAAEGTVVFADTQISGRGRHNHPWESPKDVNLYFSLVLRPQGWPLERGNEIQFMSAVAAAQALKKVSGVLVELKWPNDLWLNSKKIGGIILSTLARDPKKIDFVVMGMGLNLNATEKDFSADIRKRATSVFLEAKKSLGRSDFFAVLLSELEKEYHSLCQNGFSRTKQEWLRLAPRMMNAPVTLQDVLLVPGSEHLDTLKGQAKGINAQGHLFVERAPGNTVTVLDGILEF